MSRVAWLHERLGLLRAVRWQEVLVLQGAPLIGAALAIHAYNGETIANAIYLGVSSLCLVAHVFVLNDWAGYATDQRDANRRPHTFAANGIARRRLAALAIGFLAVGLTAAAMIHTTVLMLASMIALLSALYSLPNVQLKGVPFINSILHLAGGILHYLMGHASFAAIDERSMLIACFFGLTFAAGHLNHEARDAEADAVNNIRTNAVAMGTRSSVALSFTLFTMAYGLLVAMVWQGLVPTAFALCVLLYPLHALSTVRALRGGLTYAALLRHQNAYRSHFALIGLAFLMTAAARWF